MRIRHVIAGAALAAAAPAQAAWQEATSQHFVVYADDTPDHVQAFTSRLETFDKLLHVLRDLPDLPVSPMTRVTVFVVPNIGEVQKLFGKHGGDVAGFYVPRASQSVAFVPRRTGDEDLSSLVILLHEYSHHFMFSNYGNAAFPGWLVEGFAEFNATARFNADGSVLLGSAPQYRAYGMLDYELMPLAKLLTADPNALKTDDARQAFYARAWLLMHYMTFDPERRARLSSYVKAINEGRPADQAAQLLGNPAKLDEQLNTYAKQSHLLAFTINARALTIDPVHVRALSPGEAAIMPARIASTRGVDATTAPKIAELARQVGAAYPNDAAVQNEVAEAEHDAGNWKASEAAADRALAADPKSIHALIYEGMAREGEAATAKSTAPAQWATVRSWFSKANHLDPEYAWPMALFYYSFIAAQQTPTPNAQAGLLYAQALAPFDPELTMTAAYVLLKQGKPAEAKTMLKTVAYNPHDGTYAQTAEALIGAIDSGGAAAALATIEHQKDAGHDTPAH